MLSDGPEGSYWQRFVYENLGGVCFRCGRSHYSREKCLEGEDSKSAPAGFQWENVVIAEGEDVVDGTGEWHLGPYWWQSNNGCLGWKQWEEQGGWGLS